MPHIHTKPGQHDQTISIYIVRLDGKEPRVMFHLHKKYQVYMQFGGHVELNENPWQALIRETREETGYDINQLEVLQPKTALTDLRGVVNHPIPISFNTHNVVDLDHYHIDSAFAFVTDQEPKHPLGPDESLAIRLFTKKQLEDLPPEQTY